MSRQVRVGVMEPASAPATACQAFFDWNENLGPCGEPAIGTAVCACVHEHFGERRVCATDAAEIQRVRPGEFVCIACRQSARPHECEMFVTLRWDQP